MGKKAEYGLGHLAFLDYVRFIVGSKAYEGMPDLYKDDGTVQWEAPSNRVSGKYRDSNQKRRAWWASKARDLGIDPATTTAWLSKTAKAIHPTLRKPCKKCGLEMDLRYVYPRAGLIRRFLKLSFLNGVDQIDPLEDILSLVRRLYQKHGTAFLDELPNLLKAKGITMPSAGNDIEFWLRWIENDYVPAEPSVLSPGAMSNAPDRLDGFHSFNLCHRGSADTGRHRKNMASYVTDRRVFETWVDGDWIAADRLMGRIRSDEALQTAGCFYASAHPAGSPPLGNSTADHVGPISLGFCHRAEFQLLCKSCNSTKNNRIRVEDVQRLIAAEAAGTEVISRFAKRIWDLRKSAVVDDDSALRLAKALRDNRFTYMKMLSRILDDRFFVFLCSLLHLEYAENDVVDFTSLGVVKHITVHKGIVRVNRTTTYVVEQKTRRIRVAFSSLRQYGSKAARNALLITNSDIERELQAAIDTLKCEPNWVRVVDEELRVILAAGSIHEGQLRSAVHRIELASKEGSALFQSAQAHLDRAMDFVGDELSNKWNDQRYNRSLDLTDF